MSVSEDAGPEGGWIMRSHIDRRGMNASEYAGSQREVDCEISHYWREESNILYKGVETSP